MKKMTLLECDKKENTDNMETFEVKEWKSYNRGKQIVGAKKYNQ